VSGGIENFSRNAVKDAMTNVRYSYMITLFPTCWSRCPSKRDRERTNCIDTTQSSKAGRRGRSEKKKSARKHPPASWGLWAAHTLPTLQCHYDHKHSVHCTSSLLEVQLA
jgi:hypothetical protein